MPQPVVLPSYRDTVRAEWVDYNGHLRDAFYMLIFSFATDVLIDLIGLPDAVRKARRRSIYTLEAHLNYLHEIKEGAQVRVDMRVLGHDAKRLHLYLEMFSGRSGRARGRRRADVAACRYQRAARRRIRSRCRGSRARIGRRACRAAAGKIRGARDRSARRNLTQSEWTCLNRKLPHSSKGHRDLSRAYHAIDAARAARNVRPLRGDADAAAAG